MNRAFLYLCGLIYLGYGLWVLLSPTTSLAYLGADLSIANTLSDLHGSHGGLNVAVGLFLLWAAGNDWFPHGLWLVFLLNLGYLGGRLVALVTDGMPTGIVPAVMVMEAVIVVVAFILARRSQPVA